MKELTGVRQKSRERNMDSVSNEKERLPGTEKIRAKAREPYGSNPGKTENIRKSDCGEGAGKKSGSPADCGTLGRTREYIQKEFHKTINERTLSDYRSDGVVSCQRPVKRARRQNPRETVRRAPKRQTPRTALTGLLYCADCGSKLTHRLYLVQGKWVEDAFICLGLPPFNPCWHHAPYPHGED